MNRRILVLGVALLAGLPAGAGAAGADISLPDFPLPAFAVNSYGQAEEISVMRLLRELHKGGVRGSDNFDAMDSDYVILASGSLGLLSAWLESACKSVGIVIGEARQRPYDGSVYARLLTVATGIAASRQSRTPLAIPVGVMICKRRKAWGALPGDGERDAYVVVATEKGFLVYDPPTRQLVPMAEYPNNSEVIKVRL